MIIAKLIKQTYKTTKKQCDNKEPILLSQELLKDGKAFDMPVNTDTKSSRLFASVNNPTLKNTINAKRQLRIYGKIKM